MPPKFHGARGMWHRQAEANRLAVGRPMHGRPKTCSAVRTCMQRRERSAPRTGTHCADVERMTSVLLERLHASPDKLAVGLESLYQCMIGTKEVHYCFASSYNKTRQQTTMILIHYSPRARTPMNLMTAERREGGGRAHRAYQHVHRERDGAGSGSRSSSGARSNSVGLTPRDLVAVTMSTRSSACAQEGSRAKKKAASIEMSSNRCVQGRGAAPAA